MSIAAIGVVLAPGFALADDGQDRAGNPGFFHGMMQFFRGEQPPAPGQMPPRENDGSEGPEASSTDMHRPLPRGEWEHGTSTPGLDDRRHASSTPPRKPEMERDHRIGSTTPDHGPLRPIIKGNGQPIVGGTVSAISGSTLTITNQGGMTYTVDASAAIIVKGHATTTAASILSGDMVVVQGAVSGTAITASSISDIGAGPGKGGGQGESGDRPHLGASVMQGVGSFFGRLFGF